MLTTGNQLRAARALVAMDRAALAKRAGVAAEAVDAMENRGAEGILGERAAIKAVVAALEEAGIEFLNHGRPGVRLRAGPAADRPDPLHARSNDEWPEADA
jgi:hypothetical protein